MPAVPTISSPGLSFAYLISSAIECTGSDGLTTSVKATCDGSAIGTKSLRGS